MPSCFSVALSWCQEMPTWRLSHGKEDNYSASHFPLALRFWLLDSIVNMSYKGLSRSYSQLIFLRRLVSFILQMEKKEAESKVRQQNQSFPASRSIQMFIFFKEKYQGFSFRLLVGWLVIDRLGNGDVLQERVGFVCFFVLEAYWCYLSLQSSHPLWLPQVQAMSLLRDAQRNAVFSTYHMASLESVEEFLT